jgi:hypothetical protein
MPPRGPRAPVLNAERDRVWPDEVPRRGGPSPPRPASGPVDGQTGPGPIRAFTTGPPEKLPVPSIHEIFHDRPGCGKATMCPSAKAESTISAGNWVDPQSFQAGIETHAAKCGRMGIAYSAEITQSGRYQRQRLFARRRSAVATGRPRAVRRPTHGISPAPAGHREELSPAPGERDRPGQLPGPSTSGRG